MQSQDLSVAYLGNFDPRGAPADPPLRLHIAIAANFVYAGRVGGAEHMLYNLLRGLWTHDVSLDIMCTSAENLAGTFRNEVECRPNAQIKARPMPGPRFLAEQIACLGRSRKADVTIFPNYFVPPIVPARMGAVVCVLHDMQYRHMRLNFSMRKRMWLRLAHNFSIRRCDRMVAISESVRQDAIRFLGAHFGDRIDVVPNPVFWSRFGPVVTSDLNRRRPTILSLAAHYEHKNLSTLVRAFAKVRRRLPDARLILCGQDYRSLRGVTGSPATVTELADELGVGDSVVVTGYVDDDTLGQLFAECTVFAFPSIFEGFGMPPVEALGLGLPTLTTRATALPEVTMGLAEYVEQPHNVDEWSERLCTMLDDPACFAPTASAVALIRSRYSAPEVARGYLDVCRRAIERH